MRAALEQAKIAFLKGEVPVGAVLVLEGEIIARGHNRVEELQDPTAHAEMICLREAASKTKNWRLTGATLYCTLEPCSMCAGTLFSARIKKIIWGAPDLRTGANGSWVDLFGLVHPIHRVETASGILKEESAELMRSFFREQREGR